ncbi:hypothetical protein [Vibrio sonorensis]|uniref:hypothetical protein n=1 Tax=Vibrio sonorensis TaxID=1004316 RepID=UPI0008DB212E|nr:hypothetical protein [Vibrio sonorensis]
MNNKQVWIESGAIHSKKSPTPLSLSKIEGIYVKEYDQKSKLKRASLIALAFSFVFALVHPLVGLAVFVTLMGLSFFFTKRYELRVSVFNNQEVGSVESGLCSSNDRTEFDVIIKKFDQYKNDMAM